MADTIALKIKEYESPKVKCATCANNMYELDKDNTGVYPIIKRKKSYEWWGRDRRRRVNEALYFAYVELCELKSNKENE